MLVGHYFTIYCLNYDAAANNKLSNIIFTNAFLLGWYEMIQHENIFLTLICILIENVFVRPYSRIDKYFVKAKFVDHKFMLEICFPFIVCVSQLDIYQLYDFTGFYALFYNYIFRNIPL